jgi:hypothetical protein
MTAQNAIAAYEAATTREEAAEAFDALVQWVADDADLDDDADFESAAEKALNDRGIARKH